MAIIIEVILFVVIVVIGGVLWHFLYTKRNKLSIARSLQYVVFRVTMPQFDKPSNTPKDFRAEIAKFEELLGNFLSIHEKSSVTRVLAGEYCIALEIASVVGTDEIHFYLACPRLFESNIQKYIQGVYPRSEVTRCVDDYSIFEPGGTVRAGYFQLEKSELLPLNTYKTLSQDPLSTIANAFSQIKTHEGLALQVLVRPRSPGVKERGNKALQDLRKGATLYEALNAHSSFWGSFLGEVVEHLFFSRPPTPKEEKEKEEKRGIVDEASITQIQSKISKQLFETNIRVLASTREKDDTERLFSNLVGCFGQFALQATNGLRLIELQGKQLQALAFNYSFRRFEEREKVILNSEEVTSIYHFPLEHIEAPQIAWKKSGESAPPSELSKSGELLLGDIIFRGEYKPIYFASKEDRRRHLYIIGQTGTGKSSLLHEMVRQDIESGQGVGVVDPHGELIEHILAIIPKHRLKDVILFEPSDLQNPMGLNMLEWDLPEQKDFAVQEMIAIFYKLFPPEIIGPMFEHYMRNAMLALMADRENPGTLVEIPRIFTDDTFMEDRLSHVTDPVVRSFWEKEWKKTTGSTKSDMLGYVVSKVGRFIENEMMRNIIGQGKSSFDFEKILNEGKIFLANLSKGQAGEVNSSLLGLIIVSKLQMAAMKRGAIKEQDRKDFYLYLDEFQNFTTDSIATILSEARKYRLNLVLAHQFIPQLPDKIKDAVMGNVGSLCSFRVGVEDAEFLQKQFEPEFAKQDLINLDNFNAVAKLMIKGAVSRPFHFVTKKPKEGVPALVAPLKQYAKLKYARKKGAVELEIKERSQLGI